MNNLTSYKDLMYLDYPKLKKHWVKNTEEILKDYQKIKKKMKTVWNKISAKDLRKKQEVLEKGILDLGNFLERMANANMNLCDTLSKIITILLQLDVDNFKSIVDHYKEEHGLKLPKKIEKEIAQLRKIKMPKKTKKRK